MLPFDYNNNIYSVQQFNFLSFSTKLQVKNTNPLRVGEMERKLHSIKTHKNPYFCCFHLSPPCNFERLCLIHQRRHHYHIASFLSHPSTTPLFYRYLRHATFFPRSDLPCPHRPSVVIRCKICKHIELVRTSSSH